MTIDLNRWKKITNWGWPCNSGWNQGTGKYVVSVDGKTKEASSGSGSLSITLSSMGAGRKTYSWSVYAKIDGLAGSSSSGKFVRCVLGNPAAPSLSTPATNWSNPTNITFKWSHSGWGEYCNYNKDNFYFNLCVSASGMTTFSAKGLLGLKYISQNILSCLGFNLISVFF